MKSFLMLLALTVMASAGQAKGPEPVLVVSELNPWLTVIGSDSPMFAIYDDGQLIYQPEGRTNERPFVRRKLMDPEATAIALLGGSLETKDSDFTLSHATDQITTSIWTPAKQIRIYGNWRKPLTPGGDPASEKIKKSEREMWESLPAGIRGFLERVERERRMQGESWLPQSIEVMLWPYEYAPEESVAWPGGWPDLMAATTRKRGEDSFSVYLPADSLAALRKLLATQKERGAVLINGRKMAAGYRLPFPGEEKWMK